MVYPTIGAMQARIGFQSLTWSRLFKISRVDNIIHRLTDHDSDLTFDEAGDGVLQTYTPVNAPSMDSRRKYAAVREETSNIRGFTLPLGTFDPNDMRAGKFKRARVDLYTVDWRFPWAGWLTRQVFWMQDLVYSGEVWSVELKSLAGQLDVRVGRVWNRKCDATLYDSRCGVAPGVHEHTGTVSKISALTAGDDHVRLRFETTGNAAGQADDYFKDGFLEWTGGNNVILNLSVFDVKKFKTSNGLFELWTPTPFDIQVGDTFEARRGCGKTMHGFCRKVFGNIENFRGGPWMPTARALLKTPNAQS